MALMLQPTLAAHVTILFLFVYLMEEITDMGKLYTLNSKYSH